MDAKTKQRALECLNILREKIESDSGGLSCTAFRGTHEVPSNHPIFVEREANATTHILFSIGPAQENVAEEHRHIMRATQSVI